MAMVGGVRAREQTAWTHPDKQLRQRRRERISRIQVLHERLIGYRRLQLFKS